MPYREVILNYAKPVHGVHDIAKFIPPHSKKEDDYDMVDWTICENELSEDEICIATKDGLKEYMQD